MRRLVALAVALAPALLRAQLVESIEIRVTNVDVVVTDRAGKPVTGLTQDDFELYEDGKRQAITNFYAVERGASNAGGTAEPTATAAAPQPIPEDRKRRIVIFIDNYTLEPSQKRKFIDVLERQVDRLVGPGDEATIVVFNQRPVATVPFTSDVAKLKAALRDQAREAGTGMLATSKAMLKSQVISLFEAAVSNPREAPQLFATAYGMASAWADQSHSHQRQLLAGLSTTVKRFAGIEGRKVLLFATGTMPEHAGQDMFEYVEQTFRPILRNIPARARTEASMRSTTTELEKLGKQANSDGVTLYLVDAGGALRNGASADQGDAPNLAIDTIEKFGTIGALQLLANITGGTALTNTDNFKFAIDTIARDLDSYYSLGYRSSETKDGNRNVSVKVRKPGLTVRSRRSWSPKTQSQQIEDRVIANVFRSETAGTIEVSLREAPKKTSAGVYQVPLRMSFPATLTLLPEGTDLTGGFAVYLVVGDGDGGLSKVVRNDHPVRIPAAQEKAVRAKPLIYDIDVAVREGHQVVSVAIVDKLTNEAVFARKEIDAR